MTCQGEAGERRITYLPGLACAGRVAAAPGLSEFQSHAPTVEPVTIDAIGDAGAGDQPHRADRDLLLAPARAGFRGVQRQRVPQRTQPSCPATPGKRPADGESDLGNRGGSMICAGRWTPHRLGVPPHVVEAILNHVSSTRSAKTGARVSTTRRSICWSGSRPYGSWVPSRRTMNIIPLRREG